MENCHGKYIFIVKFWKQFTFSSIVNRSWRFLSQNSVLKKNDWCFSRCIADLVYDVTTLDTRKYDVTMFNLIPSTFDYNCRFQARRILTWPAWTSTTLARPQFAVADRNIWLDYYTQQRLENPLATTNYYRLKLRKIWTISNHLFGRRILLDNKKSES